MAFYTVSARLALSRDYRPRYQALALTQGIGMPEIEDGRGRPELEAARRGSDLDRGMDDEAIPAEASAETARHWIDLYSQPTSLETHLVSEARKLLPTLSRPARSEALMTT